MVTRLPRPLANEVIALAERLGLSYSDTLVLLAQVAFRDGQIPDRPDQEVLPDSA